MTTTRTRRMCFVLLLAVTLPLTALVCRTCSRYSDISQFADHIALGYEVNSSLVPVMAPLDRKLNQSIIPEIAKRSNEVWPTILRILCGTATKQERYSILRSTWANVALFDDTEETSLGAEAWQRAALSVPEAEFQSLTFSASCAKYWPPALMRFNHSRVYEKEFLCEVARRVTQSAEYIMSVLRKDLGDTATLLEPATALLEASLHFRQLKGSTEWRTCATAWILRNIEKFQADDGTFSGDGEKTLQVLETLMPTLAVAHRTGISLPVELALRVQRLLEFPMYVLDMHGCMPFVAPDEEFANKRELLFWGANLFDRNDFAWIAYGGLDMLGSSTPITTSKSFSDAGIYVMRNNWEIRRVLHRGESGRKAISPGLGWRTEQEIQFDTMSNALWFDNSLGRMEIFAFGQRQIAIAIASSNLSIEEWRTNAASGLLRGAGNSTELTILHIPGAEAWIIRLNNAEAPPALSISPLQVKFLDLPDSSGVVTLPVTPSVVRDPATKLRVKPYGSVCVRSNGHLAKKGPTALEIVAPKAGTPLILVIAGATGVWQPETNTNPLLAPQTAAQARSIDIRADHVSVKFHQNFILVDEIRKHMHYEADVKFDGKHVFLDGTRL